MTVDPILSIQPRLADYLRNLPTASADPNHANICCGTCGQCSGLQRKRVEHIALLNGSAPRTLQEFLNTDVWEHASARNQLQQMIARDDADPNAIGIIDDSGHPKSGTMPIAQSVEPQEKSSDDGMTGTAEE